MLAKNPGFTALRCFASPLASALLPPSSASSTPSCCGRFPTRTLPARPPLHRIPDHSPMADCVHFWVLAARVSRPQARCHFLRRASSLGQQGVNLAGAAEPVRATVSYVTRWHAPDARRAPSGASSIPRTTTGRPLATPCSPLRPLAARLWRRPRLSSAATSASTAGLHGGGSHAALFRLPPGESSIRRNCGCRFSSIPPGPAAAAAIS